MTFIRPARSVFCGGAVETGATAAIRVFLPRLVGAPVAVATTPDIRPLLPGAWGIREGITLPVAAFGIPPLERGFPRLASVKDFGIEDIGFAVCCC